jgi:hypothetical protein
LQNIQSLVQQINQGSGFQIAADDPSLQFQAEGQRLVFSELLPEVNVEETHSFRIDGMRMNSRIANSSTRYSEPANKDSHEMQSALVELREADIGMTLNQPQIESLQALLGRNSRDAISRLLNISSAGLAQPLAMLREKQRAELICTGSYERVGANSLYEKVEMDSISGQRVTPYSDQSADFMNDETAPKAPFIDALESQQEWLEGKGYPLSRLLVNRKTAKAIASNDELRQEYGQMYLNQSDSTVPTADQGVFYAQFLQANALPPLETINSGYWDDSGSFHSFIPDGIVLLVGSTPQDLTISAPGTDRSLINGSSNRIGSHYIGIPTGQTEPKVASDVRTIDTGKNTVIQGQSWATHSPVVMAPEAFSTIDLAA